MAERGLRDHLRRPRGSRRGGGHRGRGPRGGDPGRSRPSVSAVSAPADPGTGGPGRPDHARPATSGRGCSIRPAGRYPELWTARQSDLCYATTNRQSAVEVLARACRCRAGGRVGELLEHPGTGAGGPVARVPPPTGSTGPSRSIPPGWRVRRRSGSPPGLRLPISSVRAVIDAVAPRPECEIALGHRGGRVLPSPAATAGASRGAAGCGRRRRGRSAPRASPGRSTTTVPGMRPGRSICSAVRLRPVTDQLQDRSRPPRPLP